MSRNIALLTAAIGLLAITGCGDPPAALGSGTQTAALTPVAPADADRDRKPTALPLTPTSEAGRMTLSDLVATQIMRGPTQIEFNYAFTQGEPNPSLTYILVLHEGEGGDPTNPTWMTGGVPISGTELSQRGKQKVEARLPENSPIIQAMMVATIPSMSSNGAASVKLVSNITEFNPAAGQTGGQVASSPAPNQPSPAPASGGGFLQSLFGAKSAAAPTKSPAPTSATPTAGATTPATPATTSPPSQAESIGDVSQITLSDLTIKHDDEKTIHFDVKYEFTKGQPNPKSAYFIHIDPTATGTKSYMGNTLDAKGTFSGTMNMRRKAFAFKVYVSAKRPSGDPQADAANWQGSAMSNLLEYPPKAGQASDDKNSLRFKAQVGVSAFGERLRRRIHHDADCGALLSQGDDRI